MEKREERADQCRYKSTALPQDGDENSQRQLDGGNERADKRGYKSTALPHDGDENSLDGGDDEHQKADNILEHAIDYCMTGSYPSGLSNNKKRAVRKRAKAVTVVKGEVYYQRRKNKVYACEFHKLLILSSTCDMAMLTMITFR